jgi:protein ImuB
VNAAWPVALSAREGPRELVVAATAAAERAGVRPGLSVAAARALASSLRVLRDDPAGDARVQARLALRLLRFTPDVVLDSHGEAGTRGEAGASASFLLEVGRTAHHFKREGIADEEAIAAAVRAFVLELGFTPRLGIAATPEAARTLARASTLRGDDAPAFAPDDDPTPALAGLPWQALAPDRETADACAALGLKTIGDLLWLPRSGLAQRCGVPLVLKLERMLGERSEPLVRITPPEVFDEELELVDAVSDAASILYAAKRLFESAEAELERRDHALLAATVTLMPLGRGAPTRIAIAPSEPTRSAALLLRLLEHRLERERLAAPVEQVRLTFARTAPLALAQDRLFEAARDRDFEQEAAALRDRLAIRLGETRVNGLELVADHRPEAAFRLRRHGEPESGSTSAAPPPIVAPGARPFELHAAPRPVWVERDGRGWPLALRDADRLSRLTIVRGPERIAAGWWDGRDAQRAYFEVETEEGARLWLFRDLTDDLYYHHGTFN